jgi:acetylornithine deacetylase/succinyl-diaminopimelate desuccinylase-like protein
VCIEGFELGRLNYFSDGMRRCEIECSFEKIQGVVPRFKPNAILILNEVIDQILALRLPQRPRTIVVIGKISGGADHGKIAYEANLGFEIRSHCDQTVKSVYRDIRDIVQGISHENEVNLKLRTVSNLNAARLKFNHPLVKSSAGVLKKLGLQPVSKPSESALAIFLSRKIPAVTVGISRGENYFQENARAEIEPMYKGIAQVLGVIMAIASGVCDNLGNEVCHE